MFEQIVAQIHAPVVVLPL